MEPIKSPSVTTLHGEGEKRQVVFSQKIEPMTTVKVAEKELDTPFNEADELGETINNTYLEEMMSPVKKAKPPLHKSR